LQLYKKRSSRKATLTLEIGKQVHNLRANILLVAKNNRAVDNAMSSMLSDNE